MGTAEEIVPPVHDRCGCDASGELSRLSSRREAARGVNPPGPVRTPLDVGAGDLVAEAVNHLGCKGAALANYDVDGSDGRPKYVDGCGKAGNDHNGFARGADGIFVAVAGGQCDLKCARTGVLVDR